MSSDSARSPDPYSLSLSWLDIARTLFVPVTEEDIARIADQHGFSRHEMRSRVAEEPDMTVCVSLPVARGPSFGRPFFCPARGTFVHCRSQQFTLNQCLRVGLVMGLSITADKNTYKYQCTR